MENGDGGNQEGEGGEVRKEDIVLVEGSESNVQKAKQALLDLVPAELQVRRCGWVEELLFRRTL